MLVEFEDDDLRRLYEEAGFRLSDFSPELVRAFRKLVSFVQQAPDARDLRNMKSLHFEKLKGKRAGTYSMQLNKKDRLVFRLKDTSEGKSVVVVEVGNYH
jgi:proteic killer suppression protein